MTTKYRIEVQADSSGQWVGNRLTFDDEKAAKDYAQDLFMCWTAVRDWRVVPIVNGSCPDMRP